MFVVLNLRPEESDGRSLLGVCLYVVTWLPSSDFQFEVMLHEISFQLLLLFLGIQQLWYCKMYLFETV